MKILKCEVKNFGSYKNLCFDYTRDGVHLIKGHTGSGKTTFLDIPVWIMYGVTSKNGAVDDICSWFTTNEQTCGVLEVQTSSGTITIHRTRGGKSSKNDLFFISPDGKKVRGKDLSETQLLLTDALGISCDTFCVGSYFNEFSETAIFFQSSAKERRKLFEKITNLDFAKRLGEKIVERRKVVKKNVSEYVISIERSKASIIQAELSLAKLKDLQRAWNISHKDMLTELTKKSETFELDKNDKIEDIKVKSYKFEHDRERQMGDLIDKIDELDEHIKPYEYFESLLIEAEAKSKMDDAFCAACNQLLPEEADHQDEILESKIYNSRLLDRRAIYVQEMEKLRKMVNPYSESIKAVKEEKNHYAMRLEEEVDKVSPFIQSISSQETQVSTLKKDLADKTRLHKDSEAYLNRLNILTDLNGTLRANLLISTILGAQNNMNDIISKYFDSEFSVVLTANDDDSLSVFIQKNGYPCSYSQLSKGQRQILKLSFAVALMKTIRQQYPDSLDTLFFDEPSDGLDETLKVKTLELLKKLAIEHGNIYVIEHSSALHSLFDQTYSVELTGDESTLMEIE